MLSKHLIVVVLLVAVCPSAIIIYEWRAVEAPAAWQSVENWTGTIAAFAQWNRIETWIGTVENAPLEAENLVLSYLANRIAEFVNKKVRTTGTVSYPFPIGIPEFPKFWLDGVEVRAPMGKILPPENSIVTVVGTVKKVGENFYVIFAESWIERGAPQPEVKYKYYGGKENLLNERSTVLDYKFIENTDSLPKVIYLNDRAITIDNAQVGSPWYPEDNSFGAYFHVSYNSQSHKIGFFAPYYSGILSLDIREWYADPTLEQLQENVIGIYYSEFVFLLGIDYDISSNAWNWAEIGYGLYEEKQYLDVFLIGTWHK